VNTQGEGERFNARNLQGRDAVPSPRIPEFHHIILASRNQQPFREMPLHAFHIPSMTCRKFSTGKRVPSATITCQYTFFSLFLKGPYPYGRIITGGSEPPIIWAETQCSDGFSVAVPSCQVVHVGLEVLDHSALICGGQKGSRVGEPHCTNRRLMCLKDRFEVERQSIPQCEFAARRSGQNTSAFWGPLPQP
jgi:hypothetical protein